MPAVTQFIDGTGPIFGGALFPFVFITIACGAISGFHALVSSGTTPKLIGNEADVRPDRLRQHDARVVRRDHGDDRGDAARAGRVLRDQQRAAASSARPPRRRSRRSQSWGFPVTADQMHALASEMGEIDAVRAHRRRAVARRRHGQHLFVGVRPEPARALVSLRDHVRGGVHPDHARCRHARRPLHAAGLRWATCGSRWGRRRGIRRC